MMSEQLIKIKSGPKNLYEAEYPNGSVIPTLELGDGSTAVFTVENAHHGECGIGFSFEMGASEVGKTMEGDFGSTTDVQTFFQIITKNPDSLRVIIARCEQAIQALEQTND